MRKIICGIVALFLSVLQEVGCLEMKLINITITGPNKLHFAAEFNLASYFRAYIQGDKSGGEQTLDSERLYIGPESRALLSPCIFFKVTYQTSIALQRKRAAAVAMVGGPSALAAETTG